MLKVLSLGVFVLFFTWFPTDSFASTTYEFYTWGGYTAAVEAWTRVAHIFGNNEYRVLLFIAAVAGALVLFYAVLFKSAVGVQVDLLKGFVIPFIGALALVYAFLLPRANVVVYDPVLNRGPHTIPNVPRIVALVAYFSNKVERAVIKLIDDSVLSDTAKYSVNAGGTLYKGLAELFAYTIDDVASGGYNYLRESIIRYVRDCITPAIQRGDVNPDHVQSGQIDSTTLINNAKNPAIFTVYLTSAGNAVNATCTQAGDYLINELNSQFGASACSSQILACSIIRTACLASGWAGDVGSLTSCENRLLTAYSDVMNSIGISSLGIRSALRQAYVASVLRQALLSDNPNFALSVIATSQTVSQFWGLGVHANAWIPVLKASLTAFAIAITPLIGLFMITPIVGRAFSLLIGLFVWLTLWTAIDAVILSFGRELANSYASALTSGYQVQGFGFAVAMAMPSFTTKVVATFGALRWAGLGLATVFATMLVRFGGAALAMIAGQIAGAPMGSGATYGTSVATTPSTVLTGQILPAETYGNVAVRLGGLGSVYRGTLAEQTFKTATSVGTGHVVSTTFGSSLANFGFQAGRVSGIDLGVKAYAGEILAGKETSIATKEGKFQAHSRLGSLEYKYELPSNLNRPGYFPGLSPSQIAYLIQTGLIKATPDGKLVYSTQMKTTIRMDYDPQNPNEVPSKVEIGEILGSSVGSAVKLLDKALTGFSVKGSGEISKNVIKAHELEAVATFLNLASGAYSKSFASRFVSSIDQVLTKKGGENETVQAVISTIQEAITGGSVSLSILPQTKEKALTFAGSQGTVTLRPGAGGQFQLSFTDRKGITRDVSLSLDESYALSKSIERLIATEGAATLRSEAARTKAIKYLSETYFLEREKASEIVEAIRGASLEGNRDLLIFAFNSYANEVFQKTKDAVSVGLAVESKFYELLNDPQKVKEFVERYANVSLEELPEREALKESVNTNLANLKMEVESQARELQEKVGKKVPSDEKELKSPEDVYYNQEVIRKIIDVAGFHPKTLAQEIAKDAERLSPEAIKKLTTLFRASKERNLFDRTIDFAKGLGLAPTTQEKLIELVDQRKSGEITDQAFYEGVKEILEKPSAEKVLSLGKSTATVKNETFFLRNSSPYVPSHPMPVKVQETAPKVGDQPNLRVRIK